MKYKHSTVQKFGRSTPRYKKRLLMIINNINHNNNNNNISRYYKLCAELNSQPATSWF